MLPPQDSSDPALARAQQIDQICDRFEAAWRTGRRPRVEDFLDEATGPERTALLCELLAVEVYHRRTAGETPQPEDFLARFPGLASAALEKIWAAPAESPTTIDTGHGA